MNIAMQYANSTSDSAPRRIFCGVILVLVFACLTAYPRSAKGEDETAGPAEHGIVYLGAGELAPFAGDLFPPSRSARIGLRLEGCEERAALKIRFAARTFENDLNYARDIAAEKVRAERARMELVERELALAMAWYRSPVFAAICAAVATVAAMTAIGYIWGQMSRPWSTVTSQ